MKRLVLLFVVSAVLSGCVVVPSERDRPSLARRGHGDRVRDGVPDRYDRDRDGDGIPDRYDRAPNNPYR
ncbi:hypothetical protein ACSFBU_36350 [Variovorax sp. ZT5P30]